MDDHTKRVVDKLRAHRPVDPAVIWAGCAGIIALLILKLGLLIGVVWVACHFIAKWW